MNKSESDWEKWKLQMVMLLCGWSVQRMGYRNKAMKKYIKFTLATEEAMKNKNGSRSLRRFHYLARNYCFHSNTLTHPALLWAYFAECALSQCRYIGKPVYSNRKVSYGAKKLHFANCRIKLCICLVKKNIMATVWRYCGHKEKKTTRTQDIIIMVHLVQRAVWWFGSCSREQQHKSKWKGQQSEGICFW